MRQCQCLLLHHCVWKMMAMAMYQAIGATSMNNLSLPGGTILSKPFIASVSVKPRVASSISPLSNFELRLSRKREFRVSAPRVSALDEVVAEESADVVQPDSEVIIQPIHIVFLLSWSWESLCSKVMILLQKWNLTACNSTNSTEFVAIFTELKSIAVA